MYTVDCKDPDCVKCKQDAKGQCSGKRNQCQIPEKKEQSPEIVIQKKFLRTLEDTIVDDMYDVANDRKECLSTFRKLKEEVHRKINELISILRERELDLCLKIEEECCFQMQQIDRVVMSYGINKITTCNGNQAHPPLPTPVFNCSSFDYIKNGLQNFGNIGFKYPDGTDKKRKQELGGAKPRLPTRQPPCPPISDCSLKEDSKTTPNEDVSPEEKSRRIYMKLRKFSQEIGECMFQPIDKEDRDLKENSKINIKENNSGDIEKDIKCFESFAHKAAKLQKIREMVGILVARSDSKSTDADKKGGKDSLVDEEMKCPKALKLKVVCENSKNLLIADEVTGRTCIVDRHSWTKNYQDNPSNEKEEQPELQPSMTTECSPIIKHLESLAHKITEDQKKRIMAGLLVAPSTSESRDSVSDKEDGKENSVENESPKLEVKVSTILQKNKKASLSSESADWLMGVTESDNDSSLDEDDIEIITKNETDSIPFELTFTPPLPMKSRFKIGAKPSSLCPSLFRKKGDKKPPRPSGSGVKSKCSDISVSESEEASESSSLSSGSDTKLKKNPWIKEQATRESSSEGPQDVGPDNNPTAALRSSFMKFLEKNPESEWLASTKISEQSKSAQKSSIEELGPKSRPHLYLYIPNQK